MIIVIKKNHIEIGRVAELLAAKLAICNYRKFGCFTMPILNRANIFMISPANTAPALTKPGWGERHEPGCYRPNNGKVNYARVVPTDDVQGAVSAFWAKELNAKQVYILDDNEVYGKGIADLFHKTCDEIGIKVLGQESIDFKQQEFGALMQKIKGMNPDLIYFGGTTQTKAGQLFKDMISVGMRCPMMAPDGCYEKAMIDSVGKDAFEKAPFYVTFGGLPVEELKTERGLQFRENYTNLYGEEPKEAYAAYGYECGLVVIEAIRKAGMKDRDAIREAGLTIRDFAGTAGTWSFDANGDTDSRVMSGNTVKDGEFKFVKKLELK